MLQACISVNVRCLLAARAWPIYWGMNAQASTRNAADHAGVQQALSASPQAKDQALAAHMQPSHPL